MVTGIILKEPINGYNKIEIITQQYITGLYQATYAVFESGKGQLNSQIVDQCGLTLKKGMTEADYHREIREKNKGRIWKAIPENLPEKTRKKNRNITIRNPNDK